jgi:hypothetical protein
MNAHTSLASLDNQAFALMGRMHVILRRQNGRVTDIEYMRVDPVYCRHILKLARETAIEDLAQLCDRLEEIYFGQDGLFLREPPRRPLLAQLVPGDAPASDRSIAPSTAEPPVSSREIKNPPLHPTGEDVDNSYVGRLR